MVPFVTNKVVKFRMFQKRNKKALLLRLLW